MPISAQIIADSKNEFCNRITTFIVVLPRICLSEWNTHRMFSRNSASSRAIPFKRMVKMVEEDPFIPIRFQRDHPGMQGTEYFTGWREKVIRFAWIAASKAAVFSAKKLHKLGLTKQLCNRILEPFLYHTILVTATEWENFFALRAHEAAEIHIQDLAYKMLEAYNASTPKQLKAGEWHIPFGDTIDDDRLKILMPYIQPASVQWYEEKWNELELKISTARCARVSYLNFEGKDDYFADVKLHDQLMSSGHWSPFEHCARAMTDYEYSTHINGEIEHVNICECGIDAQIPKEDAEGWSGNFRGFIQYRKTFKNENRKDSRVIIK